MPNLLQSRKYVVFICIYRKFSNIEILKGYNKKKKKKSVYKVHYSSQFATADFMYMYSILLIYNNSILNNNSYRMNLLLEYMVLLLHTIAKKTVCQPACICARNILNKISNIYRFDFFNKFIKHFSY